jgi:hypothetical protein
MGDLPEIFFPYTDWQANLNRQHICTMLKIMKTKKTISSTETSAKEVDQM